jgi:hypothetical protein
LSRFDCFSRIPEHDSLQVQASTIRTPSAARRPGLSRARHDTTDGERPVALPQRHRDGVAGDRRGDHQRERRKTMVYRARVEHSAFGGRWRSHLVRLSPSRVAVVRRRELSQARRQIIGLSVRARPLIGLSVVLSIFSTASAKCCGVLKLFAFASPTQTPASPGPSALRHSFVPTTGRKTSWRRRHRES